MDTTDHYIYLNGLLSETALRNIKRESLPNQYWFFVPYSEFEIPAGSEFHKAMDRPGNFQFDIEARLISITQEFNQDMETIPKGWKTICLIEISKGIELITSFLDETDDWFSSSRKLIMYGRSNS